MKKRLLVDLSSLDDLYHGYGQISMNYGNYFKVHYKRETAPYELTLLVPDNFSGAFGNEVKYLSSSNWLRRHCRYYFPKFDIWHAIHHMSRFKPYSKTTKYIYTIHDINFMLSEYEETNKVEQNVRRVTRNIDRATLLVAISNFTKREISERFDIKGKPFTMIYNGVEQLTAKRAIEPKRNIKKPFFFSISAFREKKNFHLLLDVMKLFPDKNLYLAGNNNTDYGTFIKERIAKESIGNVHLLSKVSEEEKVWLYANCEAFLFPSTFEGFGLPIIEAMQFGKPVFSSKETSLKEIGGSCAYFWDTLTPQAMKQTIDNNLENFYQTPELADIERRYAETFSYQTYFEKYDAIYHELIK